MVAAFSCGECAHGAKQHATTSRKPISGHQDSPAAHNIKMGFPGYLDRCAIANLIIQAAGQTQNRPTPDVAPCPFDNTPHSRKLDLK